MPQLNQQEKQWLLCPVCGSKTRIRLTPKTVLLKFLLFCPKCKTETPINMEKFNITVIKEPDA